MIRPPGLTLTVLVLLGLFAGYWVSARDHDASPWQHIPDETADFSGWDSAWIEADPFDLLSYRRFSEPGVALLSVYIEGDGLPSVTRMELSDDPKPLAHRVLNLAVQDTVGIAAYLARPCFYLLADELGSCPSDLWSLAR